MRRLKSKEAMENQRNTDPAVRLEEICSSFGISSFRVRDEEAEEEAEMHDALDREGRLVAEENARRAAIYQNDKSPAIPSNRWQDRFKFNNPIGVREGSRPIAIRYKSPPKIKVIEEEYKTIAVSPAAYDFNQSSLLWYIFKYLSKCKSPAHISKIIDALDNKDLLQTKYHKYSKVSSILNTNFLIFRKTAKATFTIRKGFKNFERPIPAAIPVVENSNHITTLADIVKTISKDCEDKNTNIYPSLILQLLKEREYDCTYSSIYKIMQSDSFTRDGYFYKLV